jgi:site-specific recombinase XerD
VKDYYSVGNRRWLCILKDGYIERQELVNAELEYLIDRYVFLSDIAQDLNTPLFRSTLRGTGKISTRPVHRYYVAKLARQVSNLNSLRLTRNTAEQLLQKIKPNTTENLRDRTIIGMLLYASATPSEIAGIRTSNYLDNGEWCCIKLARSRIVEVPEALRTLLRDYVRAENPPADGLLFRVDRTRGMTAANVGKMIQRRLNEIEPSQTVG